jgi:hypothetical protein
VWIVGTVAKRGKTGVIPEDEWSRERVVSGGMVSIKYSKYANA